jgi:hypothetical protein
MTWAQLCKLGRALPEVTVGVWYRTPSLQVRKKHFVRLKEDLKTVVFLLESVDEQEFLISALPKIYFITDHYRGWPAVLARLEKLPVAEAKRRVERAWRIKAPRTLIKKLDEASKKPPVR